MLPGINPSLKKTNRPIWTCVRKITSVLLGSKNEGQFSDGVEITNQAIKGELDLDSQELIDIPFDKLIKILLIIADNRPEDRKKLYETCLTIYEHLEKVEHMCFHAHMTDNGKHNE